MKWLMICITVLCLGIVGCEYENCEDHEWEITDRHGNWKGCMTPPRD